MNAIAKDIATIVAKEDISFLHFPKVEVLINAQQQKERDALILRAMKLGNGAKSKVSIIFEDTDGVKKVETTIWGVTDTNIILKRGTIIPIRRVHEIKFY